MGLILCNGWARGIRLKPTFIWQTGLAARLSRSIPMGSIKSYLSSVYVLLRGRSTTRTSLTKNEFTYRYVIEKEDKQEHFVLLICHQFINRVFFERWWVPNRNYFTYKVEVRYIKSMDDYKELPVGHYPHMCPWWLSNTTYPHYCAVNAYIDNLVMGEHIHARNAMKS